jgi:SAM-dependent methyltransferase
MGELPKCCRVLNCQAKDLAADAQYDAILYIDVLEHVKDDSEELSMIVNHLAPGGFLAILAPAHQFLFSGFDKAIGHCRRYSLKSLQQAVPCYLSRIELCYLDSFGVIASIANKTLLRQSMPTERQIAFWDRHLIRLSMLFDRVIHYRIGKSIIGIWKNGHRGFNER